MSSIKSFPSFFSSNSFLKLNQNVNKIFLGLFFFIFGVSNFSVLYNIIGFVLIFFTVKEIFLLSDNKKKFIFFFLVFLSLFIVMVKLTQVANPKLDNKVILSVVGGLWGGFFLIWVILKKILLSNQKRFIYVFSLLFNFWFYVSFLFREIDLNPNYYLEITNHKTYNYFLLISALVILFKQTKLEKKHMVIFFFLSLAGFLINLSYIYYEYLKVFLNYLGSGEFNLNRFLFSGDFRLATPYRVVITLSLFFSQFIIFLLYLIETKNNQNRKKIIYLYYIILAVLSISLFLNWSKFNIVVTLSLLVLWAIFQIDKKKYKLFLLAVILVFALLIFSENAVSKRIKNSILVFSQPNDSNIEGSVSTRYFLYEIGLNNFKQYFLTGTGAFTFGDYLLTYYGNYHSKLNLPAGKTTIPHSDVISLLSETGIIGFVLYYSFVVGMVIFFLNLYFKRRELFLLALGLGLINLISNGLTDSNLKSTEMIMLSFYVSIFFYYNNFFKLNVSSH